MNVLVIEPPFSCPSLPRPQSHGMAALLRTVPSVEASVFDLNLHLQRELWSRPFTLEQAQDRSALRETFRKAFFAADDDRAAHNGALADVIAMIDIGDASALNRIIGAANGRLAGQIPHEDKQRYVADQQILNAVLAYRAAELEPGSSLSLEEFSPSPHVGRDFSTYVSGNDSLIWRWLEARGGGQFPVGFASAVVLINDWGQLAGGLVTSRWIKKRFNMPVIITGELQPWVGNPAWRTLLNMCCTAAVPFRLRDIGVGLGIMVDVQGVRDSIVSGYSPLPKAGDYLSPFPLIGARVTSRCYWSQCAFCAQANARINHFDRLSVSCINSETSGFADGNPHPVGVQFLDYALPPVLLNALAARESSGMRWAGQVRFETHMANTIELFPRLANSGCVQLSYGFETGSETLLARMGKGGAIDTDKRLEILRRSAEAGIRNHLFVITGLPGETEADFASTLLFFERALYHIDSVEVYAYQMQVGTPVYNSPEQFGFFRSKNGGQIELMSKMCNMASHLAERRADLVHEVFMPWSAQRGALDYLEGHAVYRGLPGWP